jgi:hypothetical protein
MEWLKNILILIFCVIIFSFSAEDDTSKRLSPEELKKDVHDLRLSLEKNHPGLYWYTSKEKFTVVWDSLETKIARPMTEEEFLKLLLPVVANVKCAHTFLYPSSNILTSGTRFPLDINFIKGRGYIVADSLNQQNISNGSELLTINGKPLGDIVDLILPSLQAQGGNLGWKYVILENDFRNYYYYVVEQSDIFEIEYTDHRTGQRTFARIKGSSEQTLRTHWKNWYPKENGAPISIKFLSNPDVAIITIKSFSRGRHKAYKQDFDKLLGQYFEDIKRRRTNNLVLDLRGNEGGNNPEKLYSYIANENDKNIDGSKNPISQEKNAFRGNVVVLMNEKSISAQETFVSIFKNNDRGLTIGRSTPGSYNGLCGGKKRKVLLLNSRFEIQIPLHTSTWTYSRPVNYHVGEGFPPDFEVDESIDDILSAKDPAMELALNKIKYGLTDK